MLEFKLQLPELSNIVNEVGINENGKVQKYVDNFVLQKCDPYIPFNAGVLIASGIISSSGGKVIWNSPKAQYLYEGKLMVSPTTGSSWAKKGEQKILASPEKDLTYRGAPIRGAKWFDRMIVDKKSELIDGCKKMINGGD